MIKFPRRWPAVFNALLASLLLIACGGESEPLTTPLAQSHAQDTGADGVEAPTFADADADADAEQRTNAALAYIDKNLPVMTDLSFAVTNSEATLAHVGPTSGCAETYLPPSSLVKTGVTALPAKGGVFFTPAEVDKWRMRVASGPFLVANDFKLGSPNDWARISANAAALVAGGEPLLIVANPDVRRAAHGTLARDTAFHYLITSDARSLAAVRAHLLAQVAAPVNDFTSLCFRALDGSTRDAWFREASWLLRHIVAYDFVRAALSEPDRVTIENWIRRNAYFFAAQIDWGNAFVFPRRLQGDYAIRASAAAPAPGQANYLTTRVDSNGDCQINGDDDPASYPAYAYVRADGTNGPRLSVLSQWFNNRKALNTAAFGAAGLLLRDSELVNRAKRHTMEWLTYGVAADGSEGEYIRNGDYCIPKQGVIYAASNIQSGLLLARLLARFGDNSLAGFRTSAGLFGTESQPGQPAKSLELVASTHFGLLTRRLDWYQHEAARSVQEPREHTHLGLVQSRYMGGSSVTDNFHELGLMLGARLLPAVPIAGLVLRDPAVTTLPFPGASGHSVGTGLGAAAGVWTDAFNAMPSLLLLR